MSGSFRYIGFALGATAGALLAPETLGLSLYAGAALGGSIGSILGSVVDAATMPKPKDLSQPQIQENLAITSAALGAFIPILRGRQVVHGNIIDATLKQPHVVEQDTGGGGGGGKGGFGGQAQASRTTTYSITLAIGLCQGPINRITKVWTDATLVYDETQNVSAQPGSQLIAHAFGDMEPPKIGLQTQNGCTDIHLYRGSESQPPSTVLQDIHGAEFVQGYRGLAYVVIKDLDLGTSGRVPQFQFEIQSDVNNALPAVIMELCLQAGLVSNQIDVSLIPSRTVDFLITNIVAITSVIENLAACYNFIGVESNGMVKFRNKSVASATSIPESFFSAGIDKQNNQSLAITRAQDRELPTMVTITYPDKERNFQQAAQVQHITHPLYPSDTPFQLNVPVALYAADAKIMAEVTLYETWSSRESFAFTLPPRYMILEPGDAITVTARGLSYVIRIIEWTQGDNWLAEVRAISYDASVHTGFHAVPGIGPSAFVPLLPTARVSALLIEPPAMATSELEPRWLFAAYSTETDRNFVSGSLFESLDGGASYNYALSSNSPAIVGRVATPLPTANYYSWDHTNTCDVVLYQRALQSGSEQEVLNGKNWAMLGNELLAFRDALLIAPRTYRLSHFLRGRKGTERYVGTHGADEFFVLIDPTLRANQKVLYPRGRISVAELYKVLDPVTNISVAAPFGFTPNGVSVKPWSPVPLPILRNVPAANDITFQWYYRSRTRGELINNSGIMWDLDFTQKFYIYIYTDNTYTVLKRTTMTDPFSNADSLLSAVYPEAEQIADFGSPQATVYVDIVGIGTGILGYASRISG